MMYRLYTTSNPDTTGEQKMVGEYDDMEGAHAVAVTMPGVGRVVELYIGGVSTVVSTYPVLPE